MIVGTGLDVADITRVARLVADHADELERAFTQHERAFCEAAPARRRPARYAAVFAAKEAVMKALGTGWRPDVEWSDIDTRAPGLPGVVALSGAMLDAAQQQRVTRVRVTTAITSAAAIAAAVAEAECDETLTE